VRLVQNDPSANVSESVDRIAMDPNKELLSWPRLQKVQLRSLLRALQGLKLRVGASCTQSVE